MHKSKPILMKCWNDSFSVVALCWDEWNWSENKLLLIRHQYCYYIWIAFHSIKYFITFNYLNKKKFVVQTWREHNICQLPCFRIEKLKVLSFRNANIEVRCLVLGSLLVIMTMRKLKFHLYLYKLLNACDSWKSWNGFGDMPVWIKMAQTKNYRHQHVCVAPL